MVAPNARDQKLQAVLYMMGIPLGHHGIDGRRGEDTNGAMREGASRLGALGGNAEDMRKAIVDQLKDPKFRAEKLEELKKMPRTDETVMAMKTVLIAAGHYEMPLRGLSTTMLNGKMDAATEFALANTKDGKAMGSAFAGLKDLPQSAIEVAINERDKAGLGGDFQRAVVSAPVAPQAAPQPVRVAALDRVL